MVSGVGGHGRAGWFRGSSVTGPDEPATEPGCPEPGCPDARSPDVRQAQDDPAQLTRVSQCGASPKGAVRAVTASISQAAEARAFSTTPGG